MKRSFTLIELLVVIAIIGILTSILMPSLAEARKKVKTAACVSNLKQAGVALYNYTCEGDGILPGECYAGSRTGYTINSQTLSKHLAVESGMPSPSGIQQENKLFSCPDFTSTPSGNGVIASVQFRTFGKNSYGLRYLGYPDTSVPLTISSIEEPVNETVASEIDQIYVTSTPGWIDDVPEIPRHGFKGGAAVRTQFFYDGHAIATTELPKN